MLCIFDSLIVKFYLQDYPNVYKVDLLKEKLVNKADNNFDFSKSEILASESFDLIKFYNENLVIIDLRKEDLFTIASIDQAINISRKKLIRQPNSFLKNDTVYLVFGDYLSNSELKDLRKYCKKMYYMTSTFQEWQLAAHEYYQRVVK